jgi:hypothetical protein
VTKKILSGKVVSSTQANLPPYGDPERPIKGQEISKRSPNGQLVRHWAFKLRHHAPISDILADIQARVDHERIQERQK